MSPDPFPLMVRKLPAGKRGRVRIDHFSVSLAESALTKLQQQETPPTVFDRVIEPGRFARLWVGEDMMMTDTRPERISCLDVVEQARGDVLIAGLGLGMILWPIVAKPEVRSVRVLEKSRDVIALVRRHAPPGVRIIHADAFRYRPRKLFDCIYFDIWPHVSAMNLIEMDRLQARYAPSLRPGGWMESWHRKACLRHARRALKRDVYSILIRCGGIRLAGRRAATG
jgi:spermidine synthase